MLEQFGIMLKNDSLVNIGIISSLVMPTDSMYRKMITSMFDLGPMNMLSMSPIGGSASEPSIWMVVYSVVYIILIVGMTVRVFNRRDI
ncbi:MAG: hypothetical protein QME46_04760 [Thermoanaerobacteraceae bacterium]|nr:hypothetical protein [Thermoanaerobacteraceae bacterium]